MSPYYTVTAERPNGTKMYMTKHARGIPLTMSERNSCFRFSSKEIAQDTIDYYQSQFYDFKNWTINFIQE